MRVAGGGTAAAEFLQLVGYTNGVSGDGYRTLTAEGLLATSHDRLVIIATAPGSAESLAAALKVDDPWIVPGSALVSGIGIAALREAQRLRGLTR